MLVPGPRASWRILVAAPTRLLRDSWEIARARCPATRGCLRRLG